jgi:hypothetical protein
LEDQLKVEEIVSNYYPEDVRKPEVSEIGTEINISSSLVFLFDRSTNIKMGVPSEILT